MDIYQEKLIKLYLKAETDIINEIARLRSMGFADYHAVAALERVQKILYSMQSEAWEYTPKMVERYFYAAHPELRTMPTTAAGAAKAYLSAITLTGEQMNAANLLVFSMMADIEEASQTVLSSLEGYLVGRRDFDTYRFAGLKAVAQSEAHGDRQKEMDQFVKDLQMNGITAFVDKAGRNWRLHTYASMVTRTTARQAEVLSVITRDPEQDLYTILGSDDPCGLCAPFQRRVYSKSGNDSRFPPLADAFGKVDPSGPNELSNTWLNIHPNCRCAVVPWSAAGRTEEEIRKIERFSNPLFNPYSIDPRSEKAIKAYRMKEAGRRKWLDAYDQWQRYRVTIPEQAPRTFQTFQKHKLADDEKYRAWMSAYKAANRKGE